MPSVTSTTEPKQARSQATRRKLLDAAVDELVESGYARLTTQSVAARAGVSRGAQQHHFPQKAALVSEAVGHLAERQLAEFRTVAATVHAGRTRVSRILDIVLELYSGPLFAAMIELTLAARGDAELAPSVPQLESAVSHGVNDIVAQLFDPEVLAHPDFELRWRHAVGTARGLALLRFFGRPQAEIARQWRFTRPELVRLFAV